MQVDGPYQAADDVWSVGVHYATASMLVHAFDPEQPFIVVEGHSPAPPGWHAFSVPLTPGRSGQPTRTVRLVRFDLLMTPTELVQAGTELDHADAGWLYAWQTSTRPPDNLVLHTKQDRARLAAMRGVGVSLLVDLPHRGETAVLLSLNRDTLDAAVARLHVHASTDRTG